jgi:NAD(P)-dependent dehydrogenase (short-subunit alcohol dehydrogenase family)
MRDSALGAQGRKRSLKVNSRAGRTAIVTGAARGLGAAIAIGLARNGIRLALVDIADLSQTHAAVVTEIGEDAVASFKADIADSSDAAAVVAEACARFGSVDILVNNAGIGAASIRTDFISRPIRFWEIDAEIWARIMATNANGAFFLEHAAVPGMIERRWGRVINVTTTFQTMLNFEAYGPSKAALEAHSYIAARALAGTGVTLNVLIPGGPADTAQVTEDIGVPRAKLLPPSIMVPPLLWLCSEEGGAITGRRFSAADWDTTIPATEAVERASQPLAWPDLVRPIVLPEGSRLGGLHAPE